MSYSLATSYVGESLLSGFNWFDGTDLSNGFVSYQNRHDAEAQGLYSIDPLTGIVRLGVDHKNTYGLDEGRPSIRLESKESYNHGLFIADFLHMPPSQCGLWPAFWSYGSSSEWPQGGEVDIIEGANTAHHNLISAHTADGCFQDESLAGLFSGEQRNTQCFVGEHNIGCGFNPAEDNLSSYGDSFNAVGGGVYAMQWDNKHIRVWHFARGQIPADIMAKKPQPEKWGLPEAVFGGRSCNVDDYFKDMNLVININFCGDYGNAVWGKADSCSDFAPTCSEYVAKNPLAFANAYWDVQYIDAYSWNDGPEPTKTASTALPTATSKPTLDLPSILPGLIDGYSYLGCFHSSSDFATFEQVDACDSMTPERCIERCDGRAYAGVLGRECYCASALDPHTRASHVSPAPSTDHRRRAADPRELCAAAGDSTLLTVYADVRGEEHPQPPPMGVPLEPGEEEAVVETVTMCRGRPTAVQKSRPVWTGVAYGWNSTVTPLVKPPVSGVEGQKGPSKMSLILGAVVVGVMLVM